MPSPAPPEPRPLARLALEDGTVFTGTAFGQTRPGRRAGEVCFNTSMCGYQEILTDPSYAGQLLALTYPLAGNYGTSPSDLESRRIQVSGFIVRELTPEPSNHRATASLEAWLAEGGATGIAGIDTRALTRKLRSEGAMRGVLSTEPASAASHRELVEAARAAPSLVGRNLVREVSREHSESWQEGLGEWAPLQRVTVSRRATHRHRVVAIDCGAKHNILRNLVDCGLEVTVVPWDTTAEAITELVPDGLFVSNGPGDPAAVEATIQTLTALRGRQPIFGICLGHQLLSRSLGAETFKLKFGHRGANQPVQNIGTGKVEITSQNHGFAVASDSLEQAGGEPTHVNLNDRTLEGFRHPDEAIFAVQYHPEASPGPHDARYLFDCFAAMIESGRAPTAEAMDQAQRERIESD